MVYFITFADSLLAPSLEKISTEAKASGYFDEIKMFDETFFEKEYWSANKEWYNTHKRGFGYYLWKPYLVRKELEKINDGDILVYMDAGCVINYSSTAKKRYAEYLELLKHFDIICFEHSDCMEREYSKRAVLNYFGVQNDERFLSSGQIHSGYVILKKNKLTMQIVNEWETIMHEHRELITDELSTEGELPEFKENRHDQSIYSYLCKKYGAKILPEEEIYPLPVDWSKMNDKPFWAARRRIYIGEWPLWKQYMYRIKKILRR